MLNPYAKAILAGILAVATALATGWDDSILTTSEIVIAISAGVIALGAVWATPVGKALVGAIVAGLAAFAQASQDDMISAQEWTTILIAVVTALSTIYALRNEPTPRVSSHH